MRRGEPSPVLLGYATVFEDGRLLSGVLDIPLEPGNASLDCLRGSGGRSPSLSSPLPSGFILTLARGIRQTNIWGGTMHELHSSSVHHTELFRTVQEKLTCHSELLRTIQPNFYAQFTITAGITKLFTCATARSSSHFVEDVFQAPSQNVAISTELLRTFQRNCIGFRTFAHNSTELLRTVRQMALRLEGTVAFADQAI